MRLELYARKFFCPSDGCLRHIFTERLPRVAAAHARRTFFGVRSPARLRCGLKAALIFYSAAGSLAGPGSELLDELAVSVDELLLTLDEYRHACGSDELVDSVISEARVLMRGMRAHALEREQVEEAAAGVARGLARIIRQDKLAA